MSTVDKNMADRIIAGEFPEDNCVAIIRYENAFNGNFAYKLVFNSGFMTVQDNAINIANTALRISTDAPVKIYWCLPQLKKYLLEIDWYQDQDFL